MVLHVTLLVFLYDSVVSVRVSLPLSIDPAIFIRIPLIEVLIIVTDLIVQ